MMGEPVVRQGRYFYDVDLEDVVLDDQLPRRIDGSLDLSWLRCDLMYTVVDPRIHLESQEV